MARETEIKQTWLCCAWDESVYWRLGRSRRREEGGWPRWEAQGEGALQSSLDQIFLWQAAPAIAMRRRADGCLAFWYRVQHCTFFAFVGADKSAFPFSWGEEERSAGIQPYLTVAISCLPCSRREQEPIQSTPATNIKAARRWIWVLDEPGYERPQIGRPIVILPLHPFVSTVPGGGGGGGPGCVISHFFWAPGSCTRETAWPLGIMLSFSPCFSYCKRWTDLVPLPAPARQLVISPFC